MMRLAPVFTWPVAFVLGSSAAVSQPPSPAPAYGGAPVREGWLAAADGVRIFHRVVGRGSRVIVYVHGGPGTGMREGYDLEPLAAAGQTLVMYDQRGSGYSTLVSDPARLTIDAHVDDLEAVRRHFGLRRLNLICLSWGAGVVARYADRFPDRIGLIVFLSPLSPTRAYLAQRLTHLASLGGPASSAGVSTTLPQMRDRWQPSSDEELAALCR